MISSDIDGFGYHSVEKARSRGSFQAFGTLGKGLLELCYGLVIMTVVISGSKLSLHRVRQLSQPTLYVFLRETSLKFRSGIVLNVAQCSFWRGKAYLIVA